MEDRNQKIHRYSQFFLLIFMGISLLSVVFLKSIDISFVSPVLFLLVVLVAIHSSWWLTLLIVILASLFSLAIEIWTSSINPFWTWGIHPFAFIIAGLAINYEAARMRKIQHLCEERSAISNVSYSLTNTLDLRELLDRVVNHIIELFSAAGCTVYLLNEETKELHPMACREFDNNPEVIQQLMKNKVRVGFGLVGWVAAAGESVLSGDAEHDPRAMHIQGTPNEDQSVIGIPLQRDNQVFGVLFIYKLKLNAFTDEDLQLANIFANQVSIALTNAQLYENVRRLSETDSLTGLLNSRSLSQIAEHVIAQAASTGTSASLLFIDCDNFKGINDQFGHPMGDKFLRFLAQVLRNVVREEDVIIRYAGDEFVILLPNTDLPEAEKVAQRLMEDIRNQHMGNISTLNTTVSVGLAVYPDHAHSAEELIKLADDALYEVKRNGKDQLAISGKGVVSAN
ncbi:sensor domain-containing diguanylate cyclase [Desulfitobacterium sp.]|uniref:GGDEF domain-containing protein n=1 Tax=Desulfitobacterium sp. TaxID=49981 RepID=UPI002D7EDFEE|nr:sensor domain-containing diguanylate cyclase [Desulfitobacterium sp.]